MPTYTAFPTVLTEIAGQAIPELAQRFGTPVYVYDAARIADRISDLAAFDVVRYAQKACSNLAILDLVRRHGGRVDCVSAGEVHRAHSLAFRSFVFPRNAVGHLDALSRAGMRTFRGPDVGWASRVHALGSTIGRAANLADKFLPLAPQPVRAGPRDGLVNIPGSMLLIGRNGLRRFVLPVLTRTKLAAGLRCAQRAGGVFVSEGAWKSAGGLDYNRLSWDDCNIVIALENEVHFCQWVS